MANGDQPEDDLRPRLSITVYFHLLDRARHASVRAVSRLRTLCNHFPTALPDGLVEQVERLRTDLEHERRQAQPLPERDTAVVAEPC